MELKRTPIIRLVAKDGEILDAFLLRPGEHMDWSFPAKIKGKKVERLVCDG